MPILIARTNMCGAVNSLIPGSTLKEREKKRSRRERATALRSEFSVCGQWQRRVRCPVEVYTCVRRPCTSTEPAYVTNMCSPVSPEPPRLRTKFVRTSCRSAARKAASKFPKIREIQRRERRHFSTCIFWLWEYMPRAPTLARWPRREQVPRTYRSPSSPSSHVHIER